MWKYDGDLTTAPTMIIFSNGSGQQTKDLKFENGAVYNRDGKTNESVSTGINQTVAAQKAGAVKIYTLTGVKVAEVRNVQDAEYLLAPVPTSAMARSLLSSNIEILVTHQ